MDKTQYTHRNREKRKRIRMKTIHTYKRERREKVEG